MRLAHSHPVLVISRHPYTRTYIRQFSMLGTIFTCRTIPPTRRFLAQWLWEGYNFIVLLRTVMPSIFRHNKFQGQKQHRHTRFQAMPICTTRTIPVNSVTH